jgi:hypothetical protein
MLRPERITSPRMQPYRRDDAPCGNAARRDGHPPAGGRPTSSADASMITYASPSMQTSFLSSIGKRFASPADWGHDVRVQGTVLRFPLFIPSGLQMMSLTKRYTRACNTLCTPGASLVHPPPASALMVCARLPRCGCDDELVEPARFEPSVTGWIANQVVVDVDGLPARSDMSQMPSVDVD